MKRIALITPMLQPYRLTFYEKLNKISPNAKWIVFHGVKKTEDGRPAYAGKAAFENIGLSEINYKLGPFNIRVHKGLLQEVRKFNPDLIIIQSITGNLSYRSVVNWAKRNNKIIVNWACAWEPKLAKGLLLKLKNILVRNFYKKGDAFLTYSTKAVKYVMDRGIDKSKITVCYNGIETDDLILNEKAIIEASEAIIEKYSLQHSTNFIYVGGLIPEKRVDLLIEAFAIISSENNACKLFIIGDGPLKDTMLKQIEPLNKGNIFYLGRIIDGVDPYFAASTCLVLPGVGGLALNQAMFWKKICIASEADGTEEDLIINGKTGFRFIKDDLNSLVESMRKVMNIDKKELEVMGNHAKDIIVNKSCVNNMVNVFSDTIVGFLPELNGDT